MLLQNLEIVGDNNIVDIQIQDAKIKTVGRSVQIHPSEPVICFDHAIAFPGLINSHDHLDFNLFPQLGNRIYNNYVEWGNDIHLQHKNVINEVLKIPLALRVKWGVYKNLLNGITTVVNHGEHLNAGNELITVFQHNHSLHSVQFEKYWQIKLNKPFANKWPFAIHVGEGTDFSSRREIYKLIKWNLWKRDIIGIHGVAMSEKQAPHFKALVWCPSSNFFLVGETAPIARLKNKTDILFGTDSTLSATWNIWEHLRLAKIEDAMTDAELFDTTTKTAASVWQLHKCGELASSFDADIVVARKKNNLQGFEAYYALNPEDILLVVHKGEIKLFDAGLLEQMKKANVAVNNFSQVFVHGKCKYIYGDLPGLMREVRNYYPGVFFPVESSEIQ